MIKPRSPVQAREIADHYDDLDRFYREIWGEHIHHGLWQSRRDTAEEATRRLVTEVAANAGVRAGDRICDVGCGYGGTARLLAHEYGALVTGLTVSPLQFDHARTMTREQTNPVYLMRDWLASDLEPASFDAVIAIESSEHMDDLQRFFVEAERVLKPCGRLVVCAWLTRESPGSWERRFLLEPICAEGRLHGMGSASEHHLLARAAGLVPVGCRDVSRQVKRTWTVCTGRLMRGLIFKPAYRRFLLHGRSVNKVFALTLLRIRLAYELGSMRYCIMTAVKPG
jgi:cyclopropane fatty-acyl-phospholipid synthase-like methyltransferase